MSSSSSNIMYGGDIGHIAATGDIKNNILKLLREIKRMKLQVQPDLTG